MKVFVSYHLKDSRYVDKIKYKLKEYNISYFSVDKNTNFEGYHHNHIRQILLNKMDKCDILLCIVGKETFSRAHVDNEIHHAMKGGPKKRLGIIAVLLENRDDNIKSIDYATFPARLKNNMSYINIVQNASLFDNINELIKNTLIKKSDDNLQVNNRLEPMKLRQGKYYQ